jgi:hypothetical protein
MTLRRPVACKECGAVTLTRTAIGHSDYQEFAFPCPKCAIEIRFGMTVNQESPAVEYTLLKNGEWVANDTPPQFELRFDSEHLCSRASGQMMPFLETVFLAKDVEESRKRFGRQFSAMRTGWPVVEAMLAHEANENLEFFNRAICKIKSDVTAQSKEEMSALLMAVMDFVGAEFFLDGGTARERVMSLIGKVEEKKRTFSKALAHYESNGRLASLWQELVRIRRAWSKVYFIVAPIFQAFSWDTSKVSLDYYTLSQKRFEELRSFFIDCFETFCRLAVIAAGFEGIAEINRFAVPMKKGCKEIHNLESMPNGNKHTVLNQLKHGDLFVSFIDAKLRNGIGHNSAHYDVRSDRILYRNTSQSRGIEEYDISYIRFCEKLVRLYSQLEACAPLVHFLRGRSIGKSNDRGV